MDGSCLFHCLVTAVPSMRANAGRLRQTLADVIRNLPLTFQFGRDDGGAVGVEAGGRSGAAQTLGEALKAGALEGCRSRDSYVKWLTKKDSDGEYRRWGGYFECAVFAQKYHVEVVMWDNDLTGRFFEVGRCTPPGEAKGVVHVFWSGHTHYDLLRW